MQLAKARPYYIKSHQTRSNDHPDIPELLAMINELAIYENHASSVTATEESLTRTLTLAPFRKQNTGYARTLILRLPTNPTTPSDTPNAVAGFALYFNNYSTWRGKQGIYLEDLFVRPQYRKRGYGRVLIQQLAKLVVEQDGGRLDFQCLAWNELALGFYRSLGLQVSDQWVNVRGDGERLKELAARELEANVVD
ncbi:Peroxygenase 1 [Oleoguttula sp. CCFEE 5521]